MSLTATVLQFTEGFSAKRRQGHGSKLAREQIKEVESRVRPILTELESLRLRTLRAIDLRAIWMVPAGLVGGLILGPIFQGDYPVLGAIGWGAIGAMAGWGTAFGSLNNAYRRAYKDSIIPHLCACFGALDYRPAVEPDLKRLAKLGLIPGFGITKVEDEILGVYRDVRVNIVEAKLETGGKNSSVVFNGLLAELAFPGRFAGTTIVAKDGGLLGNAFRNFVQTAGLERVRLEDPQFESRYQVYGSDQIAARALLTPAVMHRLMELDRHTEGDPPRLLAENGTLRLALSKGKADNLFEPPSIASPAGGSDVLLELSNEIGSVLEVVDAVLELAPASMPPAASRQN